MIIIRKVRGSRSILPEEQIKMVCLQEVLLQTISQYAKFNLSSYPHTTNNPSLVLEFLKDHIDILSNPYSLAQDKVVQALASVVKHSDSLKIISENTKLFKKAIEHFHLNLNYNILLDCTVFKTPSNFLDPNPKPVITYFLIIQTKPITSDISLIQNFSDIQRKNNHLSVVFIGMCQNRMKSVDWQCFDMSVYKYKYDGNSNLTK